MKGETAWKSERSKSATHCEQYRTNRAHPLSFIVIWGMLADVGNRGLDSLLFVRLPLFEGGVRGTPAAPSAPVMPSALPSRGGAFGDRPRSNELAFRRLEDANASFMRGDPVGGGVAALVRRDDADCAWAFASRGSIAIESSRGEEWKEGRGGGKSCLAVVDSFELPPLTFRSEFELAFSGSAPPIPSPRVASRSRSLSRPSEFCRCAAGRGLVTLRLRHSC